MIWERHFTFYAMTNFGRIMKCYWPHSIKLFVVNTMSCTHDITRIWLSNTTDYSFICMLPYCRRHALSIDTTCVNDRNRRGGRASLSWFIVLSSYVLSCSNQICSLSTHWVCKWLLIYLWSSPSLTVSLLLSSKISLFSSSSSFFLASSSSSHLLVNPADLSNSPIRNQKSVVLENDVLQTYTCELKPGHLMFWDISLSC